MNWEQILCNEENDINFSRNEYLSKIDSLLDTHARIKKINKMELKFRTKQWITPGSQSSVKKKNSICSKVVKCKGKIRKESDRNNCKIYGNLLSTTLKRAKEKYFKNFFNENIKDIRKTWKSIKILVSMKQETMTHLH